MRPRRRATSRHGAWNSARLWYARYIEEQPQHRRRAVRLEMGRVNHQLVRLAALSGQGGEDIVEHAHAAPADEPVVDRLGWAILGRGITSAQTVADHEDNTADNSPTIDTRHPVRQ